MREIIYSLFILTNKIGDKVKVSTSNCIRNVGNTKNISTASTWDLMYQNHIRRYVVQWHCLFLLLSRRWRPDIEGQHFFIICLQLPPSVLLWSHAAASLKSLSLLAKRQLPHRSLQTYTTSSTTCGFREISLVKEIWQMGFFSLPFQWNLPVNAKSFPAAKRRRKNNVKVDTQSSPV